jgi:hypothetical protein
MPTLHQHGFQKNNSMIQKQKSLFLMPLDVALARHVIT